MDVQHVTVLARERLGLEIQAATHLGARLAGIRRVEVWSLMTEHGVFWLIEGGGQAELLRASRGGPGAVDAAVRRFLELHSSEASRTTECPRRAAPPALPPREEPLPYDCRLCGVQVTPHRPGRQAEGRLCERCYRVERARARYHGDPEYRARELARGAVYRRRGREGDGS